jgi:hypothetical protein
MQPWRRRFLLFFMMRVPLFFVAVLGFGLPWAFGTSMFHGVADLVPHQLVEASFLAVLLINSAISSCFLILLYGEERADGWAERAAPKARVSARGVALLYVYGGLCYVIFLVSICQFMSHAGRIKGNPIGLLFLCCLAGWLAGLFVTTLFFLGVLRFSKPDDDDALEVFAFPLFLIIRRLFGGTWIRSFKHGARSRANSGSFVAHDGRVSRFLASLLGPGYASQPSATRPAILHSGFRSASIILVIFLFAYWASGQSTYWQLRDTHWWQKGFAPNSVLNFVLLVLTFWSAFLTALTFFVDRFRLPALAVLAMVLYLIAFLGRSDHYFSTVDRQTGSVLPTAAQAFQNAPDAFIVVAAAGGGIQSAAWTSRVLCGLRSDPSISGFEDSVLAISGVSGGSVGTMFYLRCLEGAKNDQRPAKWAQDSSLEAVAWGLTHPDLRRMFVPAPKTAWNNVDRGWALERSLSKSVHFEHLERLADSRKGSAWPILLLNSTDVQTGDPVVFTNSDFPSNPAQGQGSKQNHQLRNFHQLSGEKKDVLLETAARMSAAFPYVSPEARAGGIAEGVYLGDGGYFDNSGIFVLSEWLKEAVLSGKKKRILLLQLDAFPDSMPEDKDKPKKWYYQIISPIATMLAVRSEGQIVRDRVAGEDLQKILKGSGYETTRLSIRYVPPSNDGSGNACPTNPPLSWHLTRAEQDCIDRAWIELRGQISPQIANFLKGPSEPPRQN